MLTSNDMLDISRAIAEGEFDTAFVDSHDLETKFSQGVENDTFRFFTLPNMRSMIVNLEKNCLSQLTLLERLLSICPKLSIFKLEPPSVEDAPFGSVELILLGNACFRYIELGELNLSAKLDGLSLAEAKELGLIFARCNKLTTLKLPNCRLWKTSKEVFNTFINELRQSLTLVNVEISENISDQLKYLEEEKAREERESLSDYESRQYPARSARKYEKMLENAEEFKKISQVSALRTSSKILEKFIAADADLKGKPKDITSITPKILCYAYGTLPSSAPLLTKDEITAVIDPDNKYSAGRGEVLDHVQRRNKKFLMQF